MHRVLILDPVASLLVRLLSEAGLEVTDLSQKDPTAWDQDLSQAEGLVVRSRTRVDAPLLERTPKLRVVGRAGAGTDSIDVATARQRGIRILAVPGGNEVAVAEFTLALMLAQARSLVPAAIASREGEWAKSRLKGIELAGETLGIIGLGRIGSRVASLAMAFGMEVLGYDPFVDATGWEMRGVRIVSMETLLSASRFITVHVPLSESTRSLLGKGELSLLRPDAYLIQCARGGVVDEDALAEALEEGALAGAALDVFRSEPHIPERLARNPRVLATPHIAGSTVQAQEKIAAVLAQSIIQFFREEG